MFEKKSKNSPISRLIKRYLLELAIFFTCMLLSMVVIFYYFKFAHNSSAELRLKHALASEKRISPANLVQNEPDYEFYTLLAKGSNSLPDSV